MIPQVFTVFMKDITLALFKRRNIFQEWVQQTREKKFHISKQTSYLMFYLITSEDIMISRDSSPGISWLFI